MAATWSVTWLPQNNLNKISVRFKQSSSGFNLNLFKYTNYIDGLVITDLHATEIDLPSFTLITQMCGSNKPRDSFEIKWSHVEYSTYNFCPH